MTILDEDILLNHGQRMPRLGYGTWFIENKDIKDSVETALKLGYQRINIDANFFNLKEIGQLIRQNKFTPFLEVTLPSDLNDSDEFLGSVQAIYDDLQVNNLDLLLLRKSKNWSQTLTNWKLLSDAQQAGKVKGIGVVDFTRKELMHLIKDTNLIPAVNQTVIRIGNTDDELLQYCQNLHIVLEAYSPVAHGLALKASIVARMAKKYNVSINQLCLRYDWQLNVAFWRQSTNRVHMEENMKIDFEISNQDMKKLRSLKF